MFSVSFRLSEKGGTRPRKKILTGISDFHFSQKEKPLFWQELSLSLGID